MIFQEERQLLVEEIRIAQASALGPFLLSSL
jgi:hypothetical protein